MSSNDTINLDVREKVDFLWKNYLGFPNTNENLPFFEETKVKANNYVLGDEIFIDSIPLEHSLTAIADPSKNLYVNNNSDVS